MNTTLSSSNSNSSQDQSSFILRMQPDDPVATAEEFSSSVAMMDGSLEAENIRKRAVLHYPESLQLGKRKFHLVDESTSSPMFSDTGGLRTTTDDEAGLSLLFAASLLQQGGHLMSTNMDSTSTVVPSVVDAATTMNTYRASLEPLQSIPTVMSPYGSSERPTESLEIAAVSKTIDSIEPTVNDVLCGRGGGINKHYGNIVYRRVVEYNKKVYKQVPKRHRMLVSRSIVQAILNAGGRFLQEQTANGTTVWTAIPIRRAVQKTSQALRERSDEGTAAAAEEEEGDTTNAPMPNPSFLPTNQAYPSSLEGHSQTTSVDRRRLEDVV